MSNAPVLTPDTRVMVRAGYRSHFGGNMLLRELRELAWRSSTGEIRPRGTAMRLSARMWCTALAPGKLDIDNPCQHAPGEHEVLVYIVRGDNPETFEQLAASASAPAQQHRRNPAAHGPACQHTEVAASQRPAA